MDTVLIISIILIVLPAAFYFGTRYERKKDIKKARGRRLEEYEFYPFVKSKTGHIEFNPDLFNKGVKYFLTSRNQLAAQQLIIIGEQNLVRDTLGSNNLTDYKRFFKMYNGRSIIDDNNKYLENYKRVVRLIGKSFAGTGIEILLHNLVNPSRSVVAIENGEVTGRQIENGTTSLVLDLKTRKENNQEKLNYELNIGARKFKCTTIPLFREDYGLVGAICMNVDVNFIRNYALNDPVKQKAFADNLLRTDFELQENILSKDEYNKSMSGKEHFLDNPMLTMNAKETDRRIFVIMFSDIVNYTNLMGQNENRALEILEHNRTNHIRLIRKYKGDLLKEMGDGILSSFKSVSSAVDCACELQKAILDNKDYMLRVGIHLGEVIKKQNDIIGDGVNIASRIQGEAPPGGIVVSEVVYQNLRNKHPGKLKFMGEKMLKNVEGKLKLYEIQVS